MTLRRTYNISNELPGGLNTKSCITNPFAVMKNKSDISLLLIHRLSGAKISPNTYFFENESNLEFGVKGASFCQKVGNNVFFSVTNCANVWHKCLYSLCLSYLSLLPVLYFLSRAPRPEQPNAEGAD